MKAKGTSDDATVEFTGRVQRMAQVHHYGLRDKTNYNGKDIRYQQCPLFGFSLQLLDEIEELLYSQLST